MIIHIFSDSPHHYIPMQAFFTRHIGIEQHFWVLGEPKISQESFRFFSTEKLLVESISIQPEHASFVFHGLFSPVLIRNLALHNVLKRTACVLWGAEIYRYKKVTGFKSWLNWFAHRVLLYRVKSVLTLNSGDAAHLKNYMKLDRKVDVLPYPLIDFDLTVNKARTNKLKVLIGNSADPSNRHKQLIDKLKQANIPQLEVYAPLNYAASKEYINEITSYGKQQLGAQFKPITQMLTKEEYDQLLCDIDLSLFAHQRQQGLYVVYAMLLQGKPMYLDVHTSTYIDLTELGFELFNFETVSAESIQQAKQLIQSNIDLMQATFTESALAPKWNNMLKELSV